jgi:hypothetical protein
MGKKKNKHEASSSRVKKQENPRIRFLLLLSIARLLYKSWQPG